MSFDTLKIVESKDRRTAVRMRSLAYVALLCTVSFGVGGCSTFRFEIIDGPGKGVQLEAIEDEGELFVTPKCNEQTQAEGRIVTDVNCCLEGVTPPCEKQDQQALHYHGTLFGNPDPNPAGCGWGRVEFLLTSFCIIPPSSGSASELEALDLMEKNPPDYENAFLVVREAVELLNMAVEALDLVTKVDEAQLPDHVALQIKDELELAISSDQLALAALDRLRKNQGQVGDETTAVSDLIDASEAKQRAIEVLVEAGLLEDVSKGAQ